MARMFSNGDPQIEQQESLEEMSIHRKLTTVCCAAVLAFGLAACGSSDDDTAADDGTPTVEEPAGPTQAELDAAEAEAAEAKAAAAEAAAALAAAEAKALRATAKALEASINSAPVTTAVPPVPLTPLDKFKTLAAAPPLPAAPTLTGGGLRLGLEGATTDTADDSRTPLMATGDSVGSLGSWAGTAYSNTNPDTGISNDAVVYINRADTPGKPFVEGVRPPTGVGVLTASTRTVNFAGGIATATKDVAGDGFPTATGTFHSQFGQTHSMVGAFGAARE